MLDLATDDKAPRDRRAAGREEPTITTSRASSRAWSAELPARRERACASSSSARAAARRSWRRRTAARHDVGAESIGLNIVLPHEQAPNPYVTPSLSHAVPLFRAAQDALPAPRARAGGVPGRVRDVRRAVRAADADPDRQDQADPGAAVRPRILGAGGQFRGAGRGRRGVASATSASSPTSRPPTRRGRWCSASTRSARSRRRAVSPACWEERGASAARARSTGCAGPSTTASRQSPPR